MCGIAGFVGRGDTEDLARMSDALCHRGPDAHGQWDDQARAVHLAVRRLAILDRSSAAQPMCARNETMVVGYNGEIYNHAELRRELEQAGAHFVTDHSDTEVLLHAYQQWGPGFTSRLNGMWAFALYDAARHRLFISRDRFGQKPLYYTCQNSSFVFASELTSVRRHRAVVSSVSSLSVQKYFAYGFIPAPHSLYERIYKLPGGCSLTVDVQTLDHTVTRYWDFVIDEPENVAEDAGTEAIYAETLTGLLRTAVRRQWRADVPAGIFLSGGIDSSAISYFAREEAVQPLQTFSIGFEHGGFDESDHAQRVSSLLGTLHTERHLSSIDARSVLPRIAALLDEPIGDSSIVCTHLLCDIARPHVTVALGGEGADELLGGYDPFRILNLAGIYSRLVPAPVHEAVRLAAARLPSRTGYMTFDYRLSRTLRGLSYPQALWNPVWLGPVEPTELEACFDDPADVESVYADAIELWDRCPERGVTERTMQFFVKLYLQDDILAKVDRAGMMNSLEVRSPFLDVDLIDFVRRLPTGFKVRRGRTKYLLKQAMRPLLPSWIVDRPKHGFAVPMAEWLREDWLRADAIVPAGVRPEFVKRKVMAHRAGKQNNAVFLWSLWVLTRTSEAQATRALEAGQSP